MRCSKKWRIEKANKRYLHKFVLFEKHKQKKFADTEKNKRGNE